MGSASMVFTALLVGSCCLTSAVHAQEAAAQPPSPAPAATSGEAAEKTSAFSAEQLEQLVAPIALYPDALLTQILMAATYPLEVVQAQRFVDQNPKLTGKPLEDALNLKEWDPSVKSLCAFSDVVKMMSENLDWTQDLGDAFLGQKTDVLDAVQRMRGKAHDAGNLESTKEQTVTVQEDKIIVIQSSQPEVIYVPTYYPTVVYGPAWGYPTWYYPPLYAPPPPGRSLFAFSVGVAVGAGLWGGCSWGWGHSDVDIDINRYNNFNRNTNINPNRTNIQNNASNRASWNHDPTHRKGAPYKNPATAQKYGGAAASSRVTRDQARGYDRGVASRPGATTSNVRPAGASRASTTPRVPTTRPSTTASTRPKVTTTTRPTTSRPTTSGTSTTLSRSSALSGSGSSSFDRAASQRGSASRGTSVSRPPASRGAAPRPAPRGGRR